MIRAPYVGQQCWAALWLGSKQRLWHVTVEEVMKVGVWVRLAENGNTHGFSREELFATRVDAERSGALEALGR